MLEPDMQNSDLSERLRGNLLLFTKFFYKLRKGQDYIIDDPPGRPSLQSEVSKALTRAYNHKCNRLMINCPPRYGKTELCISWIAWCLARAPHSNFLYVSYSHSVAREQTHAIRQILNMSEYKSLFYTRISKDSSAVDNFKTTMGGSVFAVGAGGSITGRGAGAQNSDNFAGAIIIDDIHKPSEITSDTMRNSVCDWYPSTLISRVNDPRQTPIIFIGQRLHEADLPSRLLETERDEWETVILPALDVNNNALAPKRQHSVEMLLDMMRKNPYETASQYQQNPQPAGGGIFKKDYFLLLDKEPEIIATFITADTAETNKTYNDATVFSFWGLYYIKHGESTTDTLALHWLDCSELWVEPCDLQDAFMSFYTSCMRHPVKPKAAYIEKKSTGTTLLSVLKQMQGLRVNDILRDRTSKTQRFLESQFAAAEKRVTLPSYGKHSAKCIEHMIKITANDTHRNDDIADTFADAVRIGLIDNIVSTVYTNRDPKVKEVLQSFNRAASRKRDARFSSWQDQ